MIGENFPFFVYMLRGVSFFQVIFPLCNIRNSSEMLSTSLGLFVKLNNAKRDQINWQVFRDITFKIVSDVKFLKSEIISSISSLKYSH